MTTIVLRPSERKQVLEEGKLSFDQIRDAQVAPGFAVGMKRARGCKVVVVVKSDDGSQAFWADILDLEKDETTGKKPRTSIHFGPPTKIDEPALSKVLAGIKWTSNNVRYG